MELIKLREKEKLYKNGTLNETYNDYVRKFY